MTIPDFNRECSLMAESWTEALGVLRADVEALWDCALQDFSIEELRSLHAHTPKELALEVYVSEAEDGGRLLTLWMGPTRLARLKR